MTVRMRHTKSHTKNRRSHHALVQRAVIEDETGNLRLSHRIDEATGMYRGKLIVAPKDKKVSTKAKNKEAGKALEETMGTHEPAHGEHVVKDEKKPSGGLLGRMTKGKAKARSGMGGGA